MRLFNKKFAAFLLIMALCGISMFATAARPGEEKNIKSLISSSAFADANRPNLSAGSRSNPSTNELFIKMTLMVLLVVVLSAAAVYVAKRILPRLTQLPAKRIQIVETVHLGNRKTVHLLRVGGRLLLIGSTNENITKLSDVAEPLEMDLTENQADNN